MFLAVATPIANRGGLGRVVAPVVVFTAAMYAHTYATGPLMEWIFLEGAGLRFFPSAALVGLDSAGHLVVHLLCLGARRSARAEATDPPQGRADATVAKLRGGAYYPERLLATPRSNSNMPLPLALALAAAPLAAPVQIDPCPTCIGSQSSTAGVQTFAGGVQILNQMAKLSDGDCLLKLSSNTCIDKDPCRFLVQWSYNVGGSGGSATLGVRFFDQDDPEDETKNGVGLVTEGGLPAGSGDSGMFEIDLSCAGQYESNVTIQTAAIPPAVFKLDATAECTSCSGQ